MVMKETFLARGHSASVIAMVILIWYSTWLSHMSNSRSCCLLKNSKTFSNYWKQKVALLIDGISNTAPSLFPYMWSLIWVSILFAGSFLNPTTLDPLLSFDHSHVSCPQTIQIWLIYILIFGCAVMSIVFTLYLCTRNMSLNQRNLGCVYASFCCSSLVPELIKGFHSWNE